MDDGAAMRDATNADGFLGAPRGVARSDERQATADDGDVVLFDIRGRQVNPLPTTMTVAEALDDSLGPRR